MAGSAAAGAGSSARKPRRGDVLDVRIQRVEHDGRASGVASFGDERYAVRVAGLPGARVTAQVRSRRRARIEARVLEQLEPSPLAVPARCPHVGTCGGCSFQELDYAAQLAALERFVTDAFAAHGLAPLVLPALGMREPWHYRNKMEFGFASRRWREAHEPPAPEGVQELALGLHPRGFWGKVFDLRQCAIHPPLFDAVVADARALAHEHGLSAWDVRDHSGLLRHLVLRQGRRTGELMVLLVTSADEHEAVLRWSRELCARRPEITTLVHGVSTRLASVAIPETERVLAGSGRIRERCHGLDFEISPASFFQTNTEQAERLFALVQGLALADGARRVWDLYCGGGSIGLVLAAAGAEVTGLEQVPSAVRDARRNAELNGLDVRFLEGDVLALVADRAAHGLAQAPDVLVLDPPRAGLSPRLLGPLLELAVPRIVYVSCNPRAAARDVAALARAGYRCGPVQPVDLFPHTPHVECVFALERGA